MELKKTIRTVSQMAKRKDLDINKVLDLVQTMNTSPLSCKFVVLDLDYIFRNEKSQRILTAVKILEYLVKNCNRQFHKEANRESFQKSLLGLLKRQRGKMPFLKSMSCNLENWSKIQAKCLYIIQLWYDALILEESTYPHIINTYKVLRKDQVLFPPRHANEKNLVKISTESPIFDNIETIAEFDKQKLKKRLESMGMHKSKLKLEEAHKSLQECNKKTVNLEEIAEKIAIFNSLDFQVPNAAKIVEDLRRQIQFGNAPKGQQAYWQGVKQGLTYLLENWEMKNAELIRQKEEKYIRDKMGIPQSFQRHKDESEQVRNLQMGSGIQHERKKEQVKQINILDL